MEIVRKKIADMDRAAYNPRRDLIPGDTEYENLRRSIITYGMIIPVVWNKQTNRVVGGHQRLTVLENEGETEADVSVVDLDETQERQLNVALNKIEGGWDEEKLGLLLAELGQFFFGAETRISFALFYQPFCKRLVNFCPAALAVRAIIPFFFLYSGAFVKRKAIIRKNP